MNSKAIIAGVLGGITAFLLGWLLYGMLLKETFAGMMGSATGVMKADEELIFWALILGHIIIGMLIAYIFSTWAGIKTFMGGLQGGAVLGFLFTAGYDFIMFGTSNMMSFNGVLLDCVVGTIMFGISAGVVGWWLGRSN